MNALFKPVVTLMDQLQYPVKFGLILLVMAAPLLYFGLSTIFDHKNGVDKTKLELQGMEYIRHLSPLIEHMPQHRGMTNAYLNGDSRFKQKIRSKRSEVDQYMNALVSVEQKLGKVLDTNNEATKIAQQWQFLKTNSLNMSASESFSKHTAMIEDVIKLIRHVAISSTLVMIPRLDGYLLVDAIISKIPVMIEAMGKGRGLGAAVKQHYTPQQVLKLAHFVDQINTNAKDVNLDLRKAFKLNPEIEANIGVILNSGIKASNQFATILQKDLLGTETISLSGTKVFAAGTQAIKQMFNLYDAMFSMLDELLVESLATENVGIYRTAILVAVALLLGIYGFTCLYLSVRGGVVNMKKATQQLADGDLRTRVAVTTRDGMAEIGESFNLMAEKFAALIQQIYSASTQLSDAAEEVSSVAIESANNISRQRTDTEMVATAMNEMAATVHEVASSAESAAGAAHSADNEAQSGKVIMQNTEQAIDSLAIDVIEAAKVIQQLEKDSENIGSVLDVIKGIAEQTNLLALNAAIEAARAGEQGRGFAVVADEVRSLAQRTQESTREIEDMISKLQDAAKNAVEVMDKGSNQAQTGVDQAKEATHALEAITRAVATINEMNTQIASAAEEQNATTEEMNRNIININHVAEQTAAGAEHTTTASAELGKLATKLHGLVGQFKV